MGSDLSVVNAARVSFGNRKRVMSVGDERLIQFLAKHKHMSPFRHVILQFHCKVPEFIARQWYKHVVGIAYTERPVNDHAWNEISGRYVDMAEVEMYIPQAFRAQSADNKQASEGLIREQFSAQDTYEEAIYRLRSAYAYLVHDLGVAKEQARALLPLAFYTEFYWTVSLEALHHFINLRDHAGAQWEIVQYANAIKELAGPIAPVSFAALRSPHAD